MGGTCCQTNQSKIELKSEDLIREIVSKLKICRFSYKEIEKKLYFIMNNKKIIEKKIIEDRISEIFYEKNPQNNYHIIIY